MPLTLSAHPSTTMPCLPGPFPSNLTLPCRYEIVSVSFIITTQRSRVQYLPCSHSPQPNPLDKTQPIGSLRYASLGCQSNQHSYSIPLPDSAPPLIHRHFQKVLHVQATEHQLTIHLSPFDFTRAPLLYTSTPRHLYPQPFHSHSGARMLFVSLSSEHKSFL